MKEYIKDFDEAKVKEAVSIKQAYLDGEISLDMAKAQMKAHVGFLRAAELAYIEQNFEEEADDQCIKEDVHRMLEIYDEVLLPDEIDQLFSGHPIQNYLDENQELRKLLLAIENQLEKKYIKNSWAELLEKINLYKRHFSRKQNQLYTALEQRGFDRPTTTMWLYDNAVRDGISEFSQILLDEENLAQGKEKFPELKAMILDLIEKEETILYPTAMDMLTKDDFIEMISGDNEIGYFMIQPKLDDNIHGEYLAKKPSASEQMGGDLAQDLAAVLAKHNLNSWNEETKMNVKQGLLSLNQINLLFQHLPVDISYVDENEIVAFYSDTKHRVFPRSKGVIGRDVKNCHPKNSVDVVEEIIEKFRSGEQSEAEFWINKPNIFIYIKYLALRDEKGNFKGVLEMMQDCTKIRSLEGSRTLLNWDEEAKTETQEETQDKGKTTEEKIRSLTTETKLMDLFKQYPDLKSYMTNKSDKFKMLNSPMFKVVGAVATVDMISERTGIPFEKLAEEFKLYLETKEK